LGKQENQSIIDSICSHYGNHREDKKHQVVLAIQDKIELDLGERQRTKGNLQPENLGLTLAQAKELLLQTQRSIASGRSPTRFF
jgi:hypothetical protein